MPVLMKKAKRSNTGTAEDLNCAAAMHNIDNSSHSALASCMI